MTTKYNHLSNRELLREFTTLRDYSPIIDELCTRLEDVSLDECPVCEADLKSARRDLE